MSAKLKKDILKLLERDVEFRTALVGLIGFEELRVAHVRLEESMSSLAKAQRETGENVRELASGLNRLERVVEELSIAQKRTEERLEELAAAQKRTEERLEELAIAQKRTEERLEELAAAQKRTEERLESLTARLEELAAAQQRTEEAFKNLAIQVGQLSDTIGFGLEDIAKVVVPGWLYRHEDIRVEELRREVLLIDGEEVEVNLYGEGLKAGEKIVILGEVKSRIYKRDVDEFASKLEKIEKLVDVKRYKLMFGYYIHPSAEEVAEANNIKLIASYMR